MLTSVYRQLDCFAAFTRRALHEDHLAVLRHCFAVADSLLRHADAYLSRAIENVYLHGLHLVEPGELRHGIGRAIENVYLHGLHLDGCSRDLHLAQQLMPAEPLPGLLPPPHQHTALKC